MNMAKAAKLYTGFTMDFTSDRQVAVRARDGAVFTRVKKRDRYGYAWGTWRRIDKVPAGFTEASANEANVGLRAYFGLDGKPNVRLP
jgi:hypothetical protein